MDIDAFILVGGKSRRFGRDKATFPFEGTTLAERTAATIRNAFPSAGITLVAADEAQFSASLGLVQRFPFIFDIHKGRGPLGAIHAALAHSRAAWAFIIACDFPYVSSELLLRLAGLISSETDAIVPVQPDQRVQPLCCLWGVGECLNTVAEILELNKATPPVKAVFEHVRMRLVPFAELADLPGADRFFININNQSDYISSQRLVFDLQ